MEMALALPRRIMVVAVHLVMRMDWDKETSISTGWAGELWLEMSHLLPSSSFWGCGVGLLESEADAGFCCWEEVLFWRMLGGLGLTSGPGLRLRLLSLGTVLLSARREGFLCVICDLSTFFSPDVTDSPRLSCSKTAPMSLDEAGCTAFVEDAADDEG